MGYHKGHNSGASMRAVFESPERKKRMARARRRQEKRWAKMAGPVTVTRIEDPRVR